MISNEFGGVHGVKVIVVGNETDNSSSNPE